MLAAELKPELRANGELVWPVADLDWHLAEYLASEEGKVFAAPRAPVPNFISANRPNWGVLH
jgi:hypothetical protein